MATLKTGQALKKRYYRLKKSTTISKDSPRTKVKQLLKKENVSQNVRKKLLFGEVLTCQLKAAYKSTKSAKGKQIFWRMI